MCGEIKKITIFNGKNSVRLTKCVIFASRNQKNKMIKTILIGVVLIFIAVLLLGIRIFFTKKGEFPNTHIGGNKTLRDRGIGCANAQDAEIRSKHNPMADILKSENV